MNIKVRLQNGSEVAIAETEFDRAARVLGYSKAASVATGGGSDVAELRATVVRLSETIQRWARGERTVDLSALAGDLAGGNGGDNLPAEDPWDAEIERMTLSDRSLTVRQAGEILARKRPELWHAHREFLAGGKLPTIPQKVNHHTSGIY